MQYQSKSFEDPMISKSYHFDYIHYKSLNRPKILIFEWKIFNLKEKCNDMIINWGECESFLFLHPYNSKISLSFKPAGFRMKYILYNVKK